MEAILKVISCVIGIFAILNGAWIVLTPPLGDEPQGYIIIIVGILIPAAILYLGREGEPEPDYRYMP